MNNNITRSNPIAVVLDETIPSLLADEKRPLSGFIEFCKFSSEFERIIRVRYELLIASMSAGDVAGIASASAVSQYLALWIGFEAGKNYVINGHVENMLGLENDFNLAKRKATDAA